MRRFLLVFVLTLMLISVIFLTLRGNPDSANVVDATPASVSAFPVITPENVDRLTPIVTLTRGGTNYNNNLRYPVWSPDGQHLAVLAGGAQEEPDLGGWLYDVFAPETPPRQFEHDNAYDMVFSPDGSRLATLSDTGYVGGRAVVWNSDTGEQELVLRGEDVNIRGMRFNRDGTRFITNDEANVWMWNVATGQQLSFLQVGCSPAFNRDVTIVAGSDCDWSGIITRYDLETGQQLTVGEQNSLVSNITFSPDDRLLAASDNEYVIWVWGLPPDAPDLRLTLDDDRFSYVPYTRFSPDGTVLASWNHRGDTIHLWSVATGNHTASLEGQSVPGSAAPGGSSLDMAFSPDGRLIVSFWGDYSDTEDDNLRLWDAASGGLLRTIPDEYSAAFSPDGTMLATDSSDGSVKIWAVG